MARPCDAEPPLKHTWILQFSLICSQSVDLGLSNEMCPHPQPLGVGHLVGDMAFGQE